MSGVNKVIILGNLCKDVEVRFLPNGGAVSNLTVATSEQWKDKQTGEKKEKPEFHRVVMFGKLAEIAGEYLKKGSKVYLEGKLQTRKWQNQEGKDQYTTEILVNKLEMLDSKNQTAINQGQQAQQQNNNQGQQQQQGGFHNPPNNQQGQQQGGFGQNNNFKQYNPNQNQN